MQKWDLMSIWKTKCPNVLCRRSQYHSQEAHQPTWESRFDPLPFKKMCKHPPKAIFSLHGNSWNLSLHCMFNSVLDHSLLQNLKVNHFPPRALVKIHESLITSGLTILYSCMPRLHRTSKGLRWSGTEHMVLMPQLYRTFKGLRCSGAEHTVLTWDMEKRQEGEREVGTFPSCARVIFQCLCLWSRVALARNQP